MDLSSPLNIIWIVLTINFGGEPAILSLSFMSALSEISLVTVAVAGYLTAVIGDVIWFSIARKISAERIRKWRFIQKSYDGYIGTVSKLEKQRPLRLLFWARSFYGGGMAVIIYLSQTKLKLVKLIQYSLIVNAFWVSVSIFLGWEAGKGFGYALDLFVDIRIAITILVVLVVIAYLIFNKVKKLARASKI